MCLDMLLIFCYIISIAGFLIVLGSLARKKTDPGKLSIGIFHPYSLSGGGGERVLWCAVLALQNRYPNADCCIYSGDVCASHNDLQKHLKERFNLQLRRPVTFLKLHLRPLLEAKYYPRFTMLLQAIGSIIVTIEAIAKFNPDIFLDTMGYSFGYPFVKIMTRYTCKVACYIHYPIISTDMLELVEERNEAHNNAAFIARSQILSAVKIYYYRLFAYIYGFVGRRADIIMVNSSWTRNHITSIWGVSNQVIRVFPPCDIQKFSSLDIIPYSEKLLKKIISIGQFRPEKNHVLQLRSFKRLLAKLSMKNENIETVEVQLVLAGGVRGAEDHQRVIELQNIAMELGIDSQVDFRTNISFDELIELVQESCIGLHTMWNEHFGISVVEMQAAGLVTVAHNSGGPKCDIIVPHDGMATGFLASDEEDYASAMLRALIMDDAERLVLQTAARKASARFSDENFSIAFTEAFDHCISF